MEHFDTRIRAGGCILEVQSKDSLHDDDIGGVNSGDSIQVVRSGIIDLTRCQLVDHDAVFDLNICQISLGNKIAQL